MVEKILSIGLPVIFIILFTLCFGVSLILSNLFLVAKDINQIWPLLTQLGMWMSPIFLSAETLHSAVPFIGYINPMYGIILNFRNTVMYDFTPDFFLMAVNFGQAILALGIGLILLKKIGSKASELL